ncbi:unnamed protein product [Rotaria sp. Silwood1]|nr:unnamed protein product [Rotaria sp. Silwood1]
MVDINFPILAKGAVIRLNDDDDNGLPDVWRFLSVIKAYSSDTRIRQIYPDIQKLLIKHKLIDQSEL